jgi:hypothetical protein
LSQIVATLRFIEIAVPGCHAANCLSLRILGVFHAFGTGPALVGDGLDQYSNPTQWIGSGLKPGTFVESLEKA